MAISAAAALLDELMGRTRNFDPNEKPPELHWDDDEVSDHNVWLQSDRYALFHPQNAVSRHTPLSALVFQTRVFFFLFLHFNSCD